MLTIEQLRLILHIVADPVPPDELERLQKVWNILMDPDLQMDEGL